MKARRPRALYLGKNGYWRNESHSSEFEIISRHVDVVAIAVGPRSQYPSGSVRVVFPALRPPLLGGLLYYALAPLIAWMLVLLEHRRVVITKSPFEAAPIALLRRILPARLRPTLIVEIHGDWRTASRLYGSRLRRVLSPIADSAARFAIRRADLVRPVGRFTETLARDIGYVGATRRFVPFTDYSLFLEAPVVPVPCRQRVLFVAALERYKGPDLLLRAWAKVVADQPDAELVVVGEGSLESALRNEVVELGIESRVAFAGRATRTEVRAYLDGCDCLVVPSRAEGLGRVILEAFARERPVVAAAVGGIHELIEEGETGFLVPPLDEDALALSLLRVLIGGEEVRIVARKGRAFVRDLDPGSRFEDDVFALSQWIQAH